MKLFLVGYMGCGKSSIGRLLASKLGVRFVDMDSRIESLAGMGVPEIFATQGEGAFRRMERDFLTESLAEDGDAIVATGGGAPCQGDNMELMNEAGRTVYLRMSPPKLVARLGKGRDRRPLIKGMDDVTLLEYITRNMVLREPFYEKAHLVIDCDGVSDNYIVEHICRYAELIKHKP